MPHRLPRNVFKLRVACTERYPELVRQCELAMAQVLPNKVGRIKQTNERYWEVYSFSKHWPCLFPQHGPGRKHERRIELTRWQQELVDRDPRPLVRGLLHSDGCRVLNWVNGTPYPATTSATCRRTSGGSSGGRATSWGSSGGRTTRSACRWPGGTVSLSWTGSWSPNGEVREGLDVDEPAAMTVRGGTRARQNITFQWLVGLVTLQRT